MWTIACLNDQIEASCSNEESLLFLGTIKIPARKSGIKECLMRIFRFFLSFPTKYFQLRILVAESLEYRGNIAFKAPRMSNESTSTHMTTTDSLVLQTVHEYWHQSQAIARNRAPPPITLKPLTVIPLARDPPRFQKIANSPVLGAFDAM